MKIMLLKRDENYPDENQPRKFFYADKLLLLKENIEVNGILDPLKVRFVDDKYILIDGERRYRASENVLTELPCIIDNSENILELQLITSCLKEDLTVDELDKAIYKLWNYYYNPMETSFNRNCNRDLGYREIGRKIGKSHMRVQKAIDRFQFKQDNQDFAEQITEKYNPTGKEYSKVNSTISMTGKIKDNEVRKKVIENVLDKRESRLENIDTPIIKNKIQQVLERTKDVDDPGLRLEITENVLNNVDHVYNIDKDINVQFMSDLNELRSAFIKLEGKDYKDHKESLNDQNLKEYNDLTFEMYNYFNETLRIGE